MMAASFLIGQLTAGQDVKIIKDLGLAATSMFGLFIAVFIGIGLVSKEVERRSVYSLLAKPITRAQLVLGKYCGLTLTLAVNLAVMAVALYAVLGYMAWGAVGGDARDVGRAGARSGAAEGDAADLRRADAGHRAGAVLLDVLVAAVVRGADLRPLRRRPLQRRPAQLPAGRRLAGGRARSRAASTGCCRTLRSSTSRADVVHGVPCAARRTSRLSVGVCRALHRHAARDCRAGVLAPGFQVAWPADHPRPSSSAWPSPRSCSAAPCSCRRRASGVYPPAPAIADSIACICSRARRCAGSPAPTRRCSPTSTGSARIQVLRRHQAPARRGGGLDAGGRRTAAVDRGRRLSAALSAPRHHDDARSAVQHRLPVRLDLSRRAVSARCGPAGSGDRAAGEGAARATR